MQREKGRKRSFLTSPHSRTSRCSFRFSGAQNLYPMPSRNRRAQPKSESKAASPASVAPVAAIPPVASQPDPAGRILHDAAPNPMVTDLPARASAPSSPANPDASPGSAGPFRSRSRSPPELPRSNAAKMAEGSTRNLDEMNLKVPQPGDRSSSAFLTWSSPRSGGYWQSPRDRKAFAQKLGIVADQVHGWTHAKKRLREENFNASLIKVDRNTL